MTQTNAEIFNYKIIGNNVQQTYTGKNLLNVSQNYSINLNKSLAMDLPADTYTLSFSNRTSTASQSLLMVYFSDNTSIWKNLDNSNKTITFTAPSSVTKIIIYSSTSYEESVGITATFTNLMLEKGDTATNYEPYVGGSSAPNPNYPQDIMSVGDLVTDVNDPRYGKYEIPIQVQGRNLLNYPEGLEWTGVYVIGQSVVLEPGDYTISYDISLQGGDEMPSIFLQGLNGASGGWCKDGNEVINISGGTYNILAYSNAWSMESEGVTSKIDNLMLAKGTVMEYEPYKGNSYSIYLDEPLRKIGDYADYIDFENGKIVRYIKENVVNGSEKWEPLISGAVSNYYYFLTIGEYGDVISKMEMCSHFGRTTISSSNNNIGIYITNSNGYNDARILIRPGVSTITGLQTWTEFLQKQHNNGTPVTVDYTLATPIYNDIELPEIKLFEGYNEITIDTKIKPSEFNISYYNK